MIIALLMALSGYFYCLTKRQSRVEVYLNRSKLLINEKTTSFSTPYDAADTT